MVPPSVRPPRARPRRLRLEPLEDRLTLGDINPVLAAIATGIGEARPADPGPADGLSTGVRLPGAGGSWAEPFGGAAPPLAFGGEAGHVAASSPVGTQTERDGGDSPPPAQPADLAPDGGLGDPNPVSVDALLAARAAVTLPAGARAATPATPTSQPKPASGGTGGGAAPSADQFVGPLPAPDASGVARTSRVTATNRNSGTMSGGWNPALRGILVMNDGSRWFAAETGSDTEVNSAMVYYKLGPAGWKAVGSVALPAGIQQNMATVTNGRVIYSYGCTRDSVVEAWFDTAHPGWNRSTGNAITAGGQAIAPGPQANYVGAAWHNNTRIVWWTSVGPNGSGGQWSYAYNSGRGWNGPVTGGLGGYNEVAYVRARFDDRGRIRMIGEGYLGQFPAGQRYLLTATVGLGNAAQWIPVLPAFARSPLDFWREGDNPTQFLYRIAANRIGYSFGPKTRVRPTIFKALEARFISDGDRLGLVLGFKESIEVRLVPRSAAAGPIDWAAVPAITIPLPEAFKSRGVSAIWTADDSRQPHEPDRLEFAVCGGYPARDNLVYYVTL